jgi:MinD superfamily P-loop ATPase
MKVLEKKIGVIINRHGIGNNRVEEYCAKEQIPIIAKIKNDKAVAQCYAKGELIYPNIEHFKKSIEEIARFLEGLK